MSIVFQCFPSRVKSVNSVDSIENVDVAHARHAGPELPSSSRARKNEVSNGNFNSNAYMTKRGRIFLTSRPTVGRAVLIGVNSASSVKSVISVKSVDNVKSVNSVERVNSVKSVKSVNSVESVQC